MRRQKPLYVGSGLETASWYFMRISGILLFLMALGHLLIMHVFNSVADINSAFVTARLESLVWQVYDMILLFLALLHGANGLRIVIDDYVHHQGWRTTLQALLLILVFVAFTAGALVILTFPSFQ